MNRLLIDATSTIETGFNTGIQRVVRNISRYVTEYANDDGIECHIVAFDGKSFSFVDGAALNLNYEASNPSLIIKIKLVINNAKRSIINKIKMAIIRIVPLRMHPFLKWLRHRIKRTTLSAHWSPKEGDVLLLADATWNYQPWNAVREAHRANVKIVHVVYDLLPLKYPDFFIPKLVEEFKLWWEISGYYIDTRFCISNSVADDVHHFLPATVKPSSQTMVFPMGNDFLPVKLNETSYEKDSMLIPAGEGPLFLMVGTVEPRKNHAFVIDAFDKLWSQGDINLRLLIVGRRGWHSDHVSRRIQSHPKLGKSLFWFDDCGDAELEFCYQQADALIAASIDEGYGLPIIEAESRGISVLASDIKVFREVSNNDVQFFDLTEVTELVNHLNDFELNNKPSVSKNVNHMTWQTSGEHLYGLIKNQVKLKKFIG